MSLTNPIDVFIAYAKADGALLERLRIQLSAAERIGLIDTWHDGEIEIGTDTQLAMEAAMNKAEIVLLLISADFFASEVYEKELPLALSLHREGKAKVIPVILRECTWQMTPIAGLKVLPPDGIPVTSDHWTGPDQAFRLVVDEVIRLSSELRGTPVPSGSTTIIRDHKEYSKTVIKHKTIDNSGSSFNWKYIVFGLAALFIFGYFGMKGFSKKEEEPIAKREITETPKEKPTNPPVVEKKIDETKATLNESIPQKKQERINQPIQTTRKIETPPQSYDQPKEILKERPKSPLSYRLSNNTLTDLRDNNTYPVIKHNGLVWMKKNLAFKTPGIKCFGNVQQNCEQLGALYHFDIAQNACPQGWRLPTMAEWMALQPAQVQSLQLPLAGVFDGNGGWLFSRVTGFYWTSERSFAGEGKAFRISKSSSGKESRYTKWSLSCRCVIEEQ